MKKRRGFSIFRYRLFKGFFLQFFRGIRTISLSDKRYILWLKVVANGYLASQKEESYSTLPNILGCFKESLESLLN